MRRVVILTGDTDNLEVLLCPDTIKTKDLCHAIVSLDIEWSQETQQEDDDDNDDKEDVDYEQQAAESFAEWLVKNHGFERVDFFGHSMV